MDTRPVPRPAFMVESLLLKTFTDNPNAQFLIDPINDRIVRANKAACSLFARDAVELNNQSFLKLYKESIGAVYVLTEEALERGHAWSRDLIIRRPDETMLKIEHSALAIRTKDETYLTITLHDLNRFEKRAIEAEATNYLREGLTEWLKAKRFIHEIELQNEMILSAAGEGIYGVDTDGLTTFVNQAAAEMLGRNAEDMVGQEMHSMVHHTRRDGSHYPSEKCPIYNAFRGGVVNNVDNEVFWRKDGKPIQVEYTSTPIMDNAVVKGAVIVFRDISERKRKEKQLHLALQENSQLRERLEEENAYLQEEILLHVNHSQITGVSEAVTQIHKQIQLVAPTEANILISGESGTGKELVARAIHQTSNRADRPMIRVNCAAIPRELFESEFFGHIKGAFTGAVRTRIGRFELADKGTLFLDEVGEIPLDLQSKLLRVLQDKRFERVGEEKTREVDIRLIAATNRSLKDEVAAGRFREDLYFRLNVFPIECSPLRNRTEDIPLLAENFLSIASERLNIAKPVLTNKNIDALKSYSWPGNIRELQNVIERAAILAVRGRMHFDLSGSKNSVSSAKQIKSKVPGDDRILTAHELVEFEKNNIRKAIKACKGRVSGQHGAAQLLGIKPTTLYSKIKALSLDE